jgi:chromosome segregation ATPase
MKMNHGIRLAWCALAMLLWTSLASARRDPLTDPEVDQLRDTAQDADPRLKLYIGFARARLTALEQARSDPKIADKVQATRDGLQDFVDVYDELEDNVDTFADRKADLRKVLKAVIEADTEFQAKLRALKASAETSKEQSQRYEFVLTDALDAVDKGVDDHRQLQTEQAEYWKHHKPPKPVERPTKRD